MWTVAIKVLQCRCIHTVRHQSAMLLPSWSWLLAFCPFALLVTVTSADANERIDGLVPAAVVLRRHFSLHTTTLPSLAPATDAPQTLHRIARQTGHHKSDDDQSRMPYIIPRILGTATQENNMSNKKKATVRTSSYSTNTQKTDNNLRGIMENFADDFESPPDVQFTDDFFNREPYYYDDYYDTIDMEDVPVNDQDLRTNTNANSRAAEAEVSLSSLSDELPGDLELRLLGADLQEQLGYVLGHLTNGTLRSRRHQTPVRVSTDTTGVVGNTYGHIFYVTNKLLQRYRDCKASLA